jgi:PII-like signaling protein
MTSPGTSPVEDAVRTGSDGLRLRIFVHEALRHGRKPLYAAIVELAR